MKISRRQLDSIIREELQLNENPLVSIIALNKRAGQDIASLASGIASFVIGKELIGKAKEVYESPEFADMRVALDALRDAASKLPEAAKKGVADTATKTINAYLEDISEKAKDLKIKPDPEPEPGESELDARDNVDPGESPVFTDDIEGAMKPKEDEFGESPA